MYGPLPETLDPCLSLSDLQLAAASAVHVEKAAHGNDENGADDGEGCFDVRSATQTPLLDGRWDEKALTHKHVRYFSHTQRQMIIFLKEGNMMARRCSSPNTSTQTQCSSSCQTWRPSTDTVGFKDHF